MALRSEGQCTGVSGVLPGPLLLPKLGDAPRPAPAKPALSGREECFGRRSRSKHDVILFRRLRPAELCEACPAGRVGGVLDTLKESTYAKAFPLGVEQSGGLFGQVQAKPP